MEIKIILVAFACFLTLYCIILKRDPEPFQSFINKHKRSARKAYNNSKDYIYKRTKVKPTF